MGSLAKKIRALTIRSSAEAKLREKKRRDEAKKAQERAMLRAQTPDGLSPEKRAKLLAAQKRLGEDPRNQRIVEAASLEKRVQQVKREHHIGHVSPPVYMGEPVEPKDVPESIAQRLNRQKKERDIRHTQERVTVASLAAFANQAQAMPSVVEADHEASTEAVEQEQFGEQLKAMLARVQQPGDSDVIKGRTNQPTGAEDSGIGVSDSAQRETHREAQDSGLGGSPGDRSSAPVDASRSRGHARRTRGAR